VLLAQFLNQYVKERNLGCKDTQKNGQKTLFLPLLITISEKPPQNAPQTPFLAKSTLQGGAYHINFFGIYETKAFSVFFFRHPYLPLLLQIWQILQLKVP